MTAGQGGQRLPASPYRRTPPARPGPSDAPTGGSNNSWNRQDLEKIFTLYLGDRTFHRHIWNGVAGPLPHPPLHKRGYIFHYSTTVIGHIARLKPVRTTDWYNRETDFRFQIPYWFKQFPQANMKLDFCFKDGWLSGEDRKALVRRIAGQCHGVEIHRCTGLVGPGAFVHTLELKADDGADGRPVWQRID